MHTAAFDYALPPALIAQEPVTPRDSSRLLVVHRRNAARRFEHRRFADIGDYLQAGDLLVANDTRVIPGRLWAQRPGGGGVELLLLRPMREGWWEALARPARRLRAGTTLTLIGPPGHASGPRGPEGKRGPAASPDPQPDPRIEVGERTANGGVQVRPLAPLSAVLAHYGQVPLPPYIQRPLTDAERYQTIYGQREGSAAAPTAGLHFTPQLLDQLRAKQVQLAFVTLHIGLDTFRPIRTETIESHRMHAEYVTLNEETAAAISTARTAGRRVIAVGTTAVRTWRQRRWQQPVVRHWPPAHRKPAHWPPSRRSLGQLHPLRRRRPALRGTRSMAHPPTCRPRAAGRRSTSRRGINSGS